MQCDLKGPLDQGNALWAPSRGVALLASSPHYVTEPEIDVAPRDAHTALSRFEQMCAVV